MTAPTGERLARGSVAGVSPYTSDVFDGAVDLSDNTNLWGPPPAAVRALQDAPETALSRYPTLYSESLRASLLEYVSLDADATIDVVTGCGSDDVIDTTMRAFGEPGDRVAFSTPTFSMIPLFARLNGLSPTAVPLTPTYDVDADRLVECRAKITYLCAPNNPTATAVSRAAVEYVVENAAGIVLLDEAYAEFAPESFCGLVSRSDRLVVARTFSKAFGLAGIRVGYGIGARTLTSLIARARGPYKVSSLAERAAVAALSPVVGGLPWVRQHALLAITLRQRLVTSLQELGLTVLPSEANFVMVPMRRSDTIARSLKERGVLVRAFRELPTELPEFAASGGQALRISVGPWEMMQILLDHLASVLS